METQRRQHQGKTSVIDRHRRDCNQLLKLLDIDNVITAMQQAETKRVADRAEAIRLKAAEEAALNAKKAGYRMGKGTGSS